MTVSISSIEEDNNNSPAICIHISAHGNRDGLQIGGDFVKWNELLKFIQPVLKNNDEYSGNRILILSSCEANYQEITKNLTKILKNSQELIPPKYVFTTIGEIPWASAAVGWTIFYHLLPNADLEEKNSIKKILKNISDIKVGDIMYYRWDDSKEKYLYHNPSGD